MIPLTRPLAGAAPLFLLAGLLVAACAVVPEPPRTAPSGLADRPEALLERLAADEAAVTTLRGLASIRYDGPAGSGSGTQAIVVALPDRARLEALSPMGTVVLLLAIRGDLLTAYAPAQHEYAVGRATRETLGRLVRLPVPPGPLLRLLVGLPPLPIQPGDPRVRVTAEATGTRVESVDGPFWQRMWTGPDGTWVERGELGEAAGLLLRFQFGERRRLHGATVPFGVQFDEVTAGTRLVIRYETVRLNEPVEPWLFELPRPADGRTRVLDLGGGTPP
ncbi:MAG: hypothetical protein HY766_14130 [candidate division NC10 bacterium]|nr:hypothetical protein [candidate division NC10 bacterium]MBI4839728.1 hypothetical protein [candidate division NC10 bacterium]